MAAPDCPDAAPAASDPPAEPALLVETRRRASKNRCPDRVPAPPRTPINMDTWLAAARAHHRKPAEYLRATRRSTPPRHPASDSCRSRLFPDRSADRGGPDADARLSR